MNRASLEDVAERIMRCAPDPFRPRGYQRRGRQLQLAQTALERVVLLADRGGQVILELAEEDALLGPLILPVVAIHLQQPLHAVRTDVQPFTVEAIRRWRVANCRLAH